MFQDRDRRGTTRGTGWEALLIPRAGADGVLTSGAVERQREPQVGLRCDVGVEPVARTCQWLGMQGAEGETPDDH